MGAAPLLIRDRRGTEHPYTRPVDVKVVVGPGDSAVEWIRWREDACETGSPPGDVLRRFIGLRTATTARIARFAERFGYLGLCPHGRPASHMTEGAYCQRFEVNGWMLEPVDSWRCYAAKAHGVLSLLAALRLGRHSRLAKHWQAALREPPVAEPNFPLRPSRALLAAMGLLLDAVSNPDVLVGALRELQVPSETMPEGVFWDVDQLPLCDQQERLAWLIDDWFVSAGVRPVIQWHEATGRPAIALSFAHNLFELLALELASTFASEPDVYRCDGCGEPYLRTVRRPRTGDRQYCPSCRADTERASKRDSAQRRRLAERLARAGSLPASV